MAWYRCMGGSGLPAGLQTDMDAVLNKKFSTSTTYPPADWPDTVNLLGPLPERTASASIAHIEDGASEVPLKNWLVTLPASLSGYSSIVGTKSGKNLLDTSAFDSLEYYTVNANGSITVNSSDSRSWSNVSALIFLKEGTYTLSRKLTGSQCYIRSSLDNYASNACSLGNSSTKNSFTLTGDAYIKIKVGYNGSYPFTDTYQLEVGSTESTFEKYTAPTQYTASLGRTIYGGTADIVTGEGEDENGNTFTFTPITPTPETALGVNNFWTDEGDSSVTYRAVDTVQPIPPVPPTLVSKNVTQNGTYEAEDDDADGYDEVTVNVPPYSFMPTWTETKLVDNTSLASSITFSEDYHNYQMLRFVIYNSSTQIYDSIFVLPSGIDKAFTYSSNKFCLNQQITGYTNQYVTYQEDSLLSWSRTGNRNCNVYEVYGMTFTNATLTTEVIYSRDAIANTNVTPTPPSGKTFFDYDAIIYMCCTTDTNITHFCKWWITKPKLSLFTDSVGYGIPLFAYNAGKPVVFTETSIGTYGFFYVVGLNFTAT